MKSLIIFIAFYLYCSIAQQTTFEEAIPPVDDAILSDLIPPMGDAVPPREPPMVDAVPPREPPMVDAVPPKQVPVPDTTVKISPPIDDYIPELYGVNPPAVDDAVPPMEARGIIVHDAVPPMRVPPPTDDGVIIADAVPPMVDAVPPVDDAIPPMQTREGSINGLFPNSLLPNGLVGNGLVGNSLIGNALVGNSLIGNGILNGYQINGDQVTLFGFTLSAVDSIREANPDNTLNELIPYLVHCALPPWKSWIGTLNGEETEIWGVLGLAADIDEIPMLPTQQQLVSACLLSSVNYFGEHIEISSRNYPSAGATKDELKDFKMFEGAFFGDVFAADGDNKKFACQGTPTSVALDHSEDREWRRCTDPGYDCTIEVMGECSDVCSYFTEDYGYSQCLGSDGKSYPAINVFLGSKGKN